MKNKLAALAAAAVIAFSAAPAYANSSETATEDYSSYSALDNLPTPSPTEATRRTISTEGSGHVVDNITDTNSENLQFITVTAKDGNVFYIVIDKQNSNDNVYLLNTVDESDLAALVKDYTPAATATPTPAAETAAPETGTETVTTENESSPISGTTLILILAVLAAAGIGIYYFKVVIPKRKLEQADDLEDFDFEDETDTEEVVNEDDIVENDTKNI